MDYVLTLICASGSEELDASIVAEAVHALNAQNATTGEPDWLAANTACDIPFRGLDLIQARTCVELQLEGFPIDAVSQEAEGRRKHLLIADMDSTMVIGETLDELADFANCKEQVSDITIRAMRGELRFVEALRERVSLLEGLSESALEKTYDDIKLMPGAKTLLATMKANGAKSMLVSGGFEFFTERIARRLGFDANKGNRLEIIDGLLSGRVIDPIINKDAKLEVLYALCSRHSIAIKDTLAVGDGANDLPMLMAAGLGVAYHAKPIVSAHTRVSIEHADLTALLYLQGYRAEEFISA
ncbi:MAG: phosphoserine phosphatase SerB [Rhodospirillales bacterium]|nr:phosphoserine phosphatase SerB [Rhodospirillales bacterium]